MAGMDHSRGKYSPSLELWRMLVDTTVNKQFHRAPSHFLIAFLDVRTNQHTFVFGPRVSVSVGKITPFAHYLVGAGHISVKNGGSDTSLAQTVGGGIDYKLIPLV